MSCHISVALLPDHLGSDAEYDLFVVIDTLRFTTTAVAALQAGAVDLLAVPSVEQARSEAGRSVLLCGERFCRPIDGFDLGNSPLEFTQQTVAQRHLVFTTTNGTRAVTAAGVSQNVLLAAIVNRQAVCSYIATNALNACIICAGTDKQIALEDVLAAGGIIAGLQKNDSVQVTLGNDASYLARALWQAHINSSAQDAPVAIRSLFNSCAGGKNLIETGFSADLDFAAHLDSSATVPVAPAGSERFRLDNV